MKYAVMIANHGSQFDPYATSAATTRHLRHDLIEARLFCRKCRNVAASQFDVDIGEIYLSKFPFEG